MQKLNNLSTKSVILISFLLGVLLGGSALFYVTYSPFTQASNQEIKFEAKAYEDLVRFKAKGSNVSKIQVEIYDLSGRRIYQGENTSQALDWQRTTDSGERLTKGTYLYVTKAFNQNNLVKTSGIGKMYISPGSVNLQPAPALGDTFNNNLDGGQSVPVMAVDQDNSGETWAFGKVLAGTTDDSGTSKLKVNAPVSKARDAQFLVRDGTTGGYFKVSEWRTSNSAYVPNFSFSSSEAEGIAGGIIGVLDSGQDVFKSSKAAVLIQGETKGSEQLSNSNVFMVRNYADPKFTINSAGNVGVGTGDPSATLEVRGTASDLLALYDPTSSTTSAKFRVEKDGTVRADGTYYGADFKTGSADVAEKVNMSEWVEKGQLVEIDPEHDGYFRKTKTSYSTRVAGIISTNPGVTLGNSKGSESGDWDDTRPSIALAGRVPVKVTAENGPIEIGDTLTSSSRPGFGMKCKRESKCTGAVVGKAMEPLEKQEGTIMVQVSLN